MNKGAVSADKNKARILIERKQVPENKLIAQLDAHFMKEKVKIKITVSGPNNIEKKRMIK